jgi:hypothetical protein
MNVEIGAEAALFPEKEYIKGIFFAVYNPITPPPSFHTLQYTCIVYFTYSHREGGGIANQRGS